MAKPGFMIGMDGSRPYWGGMKPGGGHPMGPQPAPRRAGVATSHVSDVQNETSAQNAARRIRRVLLPADAGFLGRCRLEETILSLPKGGRTVAQQLSKKKAGFPRFPSLAEFTRNNGRSYKK